MRRHGYLPAWPTLFVGLAISFLALLGAQSPAWAQNAYQATYTLGIGGRSGCLVCHSDRNMARLTAGRNISYYISEGVLNSSAHRDISCLACHTDFSYGTPHTTKKDWKEVASQSCKGCHRNAYQRYIASAHGKAWRPGSKKAPMCATCHGSHAIASSKGSQTPGSYAWTGLGGPANQYDGMKMCGGCHRKSANSYSDYYHGAAYKNGAPDAPACWDCHGSHKVYGVRSKNANVSEMDLVQACGQCHTGVSKAFLDYTPMIHRSEQIRQDNILWRGIRPLTEWLSSTKDMLISIARSLF